MTQTLAPKLTPTDKRYAFIGECTAPIADQHALAEAAKGTGIEISSELTVEELTEIAVKMSQGKHLGRTSRWRIACDFAAIEIGHAEKAGTLDQSTARWAVVQGSVYMAHGA